jgi:DNA-binding LacI/PurR family transcriptional regulator
VNNPSQRRPVIADVARLAGVSVPTVSRVLTGSVPVSEEKRALVHAAIEALRYRPNAAARALVSGHRSMIGIVAIDTTRYGYSQTIKGIEASARDAGYVVVIVVVGSGGPGEQQAAIDTVLGQSVAGVVVLEFDPVGVAVSDALPMTIPAVAVGTSRRRSSRHPRAYLDDQAAATVATEYLLELGHRTVHHLAIPLTTGRVGRALGWHRALVAAGAPVPARLDAAYDAVSGYEVGRLLADDPEVTAVLCGNDELAIGLMRALSEAGRAVPDEVSVVGFDDQPYAAMWTPSLTTVVQDFDHLGRRAFAQLEALMRTGSAPRVWRETPRLVIRESTAPPPGASGVRLGAQPPGVRADSRGDTACVPVLTGERPAVSHGSLARLTAPQRSWGNVPDAADGLTREV